MAFGIGPTLTMGAVEAVEKHGSEELRDTYLPKLVSGEWMGTMNLTEPQAGSDLGALRTRATRRGDGTYRIFGQKIFITYGEHDFTDNIVHLVLARLPDAPAGTRGISLFLVPKFLVDDDGSLGARNDVFCHSLEHKLGIHGSPTCTMIYGDGKFGEAKGAIGWLVGEENKGLACMFTMMNNARLAVGHAGRRHGRSRDPEGDRLCPRAPPGQGAGLERPGHEPDRRSSRRRAHAADHEGADAAPAPSAYACAHAIDMAAIAGHGRRGHWRDRANLLTPVAKAFATDIGVEVASIGVQVHGGMGFIEETGAARCCATPALRRSTKAPTAFRRSTL